MAVAQAVLASIGLEALGLGAPSEPTLGDDDLLADERIRLPARPVVVDRRADHRARACCSSACS